MFPLASVTSSTAAGALHRLQHMLAARDWGGQLVGQTSTARLKGLCTHMVVTSTFDEADKSTTDHVPFSFFPPLVYSSFSGFFPSDFYDLVLALLC